VLGGMLPQLVAADGAGGATGIPQTDDNCDLAVGGDLARSEYGVTGAGITVGILSDSFNLLGGMAADIADGDLPANVKILQEGTSGNDEGRAMADLVHSVAPGAAIDFYSATGSEAGFAAGIAALQAAGCQVIVDDVAYLDEPFFQDGGVVQQAVENAVADGVSYFTAASNEGTDYVQQNFTPMQLAVRGLPGGVVVQNFGSAADPQPWTDVTLPKDGQIELDMQWDQPFASIGNGAGSANSIGMALYNSAGALVAVTSTDDVGANPVQVLTYANTGDSTDFRLVVFANGGASLPGTFKIINYGNGTINNDQGTGSGTVIGHEMVADANTVGAVAYSATQAFGGSNTVQSFSSVGTGEFLLNASGQLLATPETTDKVNFLAPDGSMTSVFAPFYGTSAAAPVAAAVAALMLQADPSLTPAQVTSILEESAAPATGPAGGVGAGLIQAPGAVQLALGMHSTLGGIIG
jgi:subtilisin family serine protease